MKDLAIIVPTIRPHNINRLVQSIHDNIGKYTYELILVGPFCPPEEVKHNRNIKFVKDYGSPVRCSEIGRSLVEAEVVTWGADDGIYINNGLALMLDAFNSSIGDKSVVLAKYFEGTPIVQPDSYFKLNGSFWTASPKFNPDWWLFNVGMMLPSYLNDIGGWDCIFEGTFYSHTDLAVRVQADDSNIIMLDNQVFACEHMPERTGDHGPIHDAQTYSDINIFKDRYFNKVTIPYVTTTKWYEVPRVWERRFGK